MPPGTPRTLRSTCRCTDDRRPWATASAGLGAACFADPSPPRDLLRTAPDWIRRPVTCAHLSQPTLATPYRVQSGPWSGLDVATEPRRLSPASPGLSNPSSVHCTLARQAGGSRSTPLRKAMTRSRQAPRLRRGASTALLVVLLAVGSLPIAPAALAVPPPRPALSHDVSTPPPADATASETHGAPTFRHPAADAPAVLDTKASGAGQPSIVYQ